MTGSMLAGAMSRRMLLRAGGALAAGGILTPLATAHADGEATDYAHLRSRYRDMVLGTDFDRTDEHIDAGVTDLVSRALDAQALLVPGPDRDRVFSDQPFVSSASVYWTFDRLLTMALAHQTPSADSHGDPSLLEQILSGLVATESLMYRAGREEFDNWWHWEIGAPTLLGGVLVVLDGLVPTDLAGRLVAAMDWFVGDPGWQFERYPNRPNRVSTATNRVDLCRNAILIGMLAESSSHLTLAGDRLADTLAYATELDSPSGLYPDGSYLAQGRVPYTGAYGIDTMAGLSRLLGLLGGTPWLVGDPRVSRIIDAVESAFAPVVFDATVMDPVRGRSIARGDGRAQASAHSLIESMLRLTTAADPATADRWRNICAGWIDRDSVSNIMAGASLPRISLVKELLADPDVSPAAEPTGFRIFPAMARVVHRGPGWACMIAAASDRVAVYDYQLGENYNGFHTAAGWMQLHLSADGGQFSDGYWPTANLYGLPGTTVDTTALPPGSGGGSAGRTLAPNAWAGGVALDDRLGAFGQILHGVGSAMTARQSWFCLDEQIVALGAGITGGSGEPIITTVEDRLLRDRSAHVLTVNDTERSTGEDWVQSYAPGAWAHLSGMAGYVMLDRDTELQVTCGERTGTWQQVDQNADADPVRRAYATLAIDHGRADNPYTVVVDTHAGEPAFTKVGSWTETTKYPSFNGGSLLGSSPNHAGDSWVVWRPPVPTDGRYQVAVWFPPAANNAPSAPYTVSHADGSDVVVLNQRVDAGEWQVLGEYDFAAGRAEIRMDVDGSGHPKADAVRLREVRDAPVGPDSAYAYTVLPAATLERTRAEATDPSVTVLANTASIQAVAAPGAVTLANFFEAGSIRRISVDGAASVAMSTGAGQVTLAVSDPTGRRDKVRVTAMVGGVDRLVHRDATVQFSKERASLRVEVDTSDRDGRTHRIVLSR